jgi:translation initiation factor 1
MLDSDCSCPATTPPPARPEPSAQTAWLSVQKRPKGKVVSLVRNLEPNAAALDELSAVLKQRCGTGGTVKDGAIELQGDHLAKIEAALVGLGYRVKRK